MDSEGEPERAMPSQEGSARVHLQVGTLRFGLSPRRNAPDREHVLALAGCFDKLPPILVHAPTCQVIDGVHRVLAARQLDRRSISALLFDGSHEEAMILAVQTNVAHGKPLTLRERKAAARTILGRQPDWSDRRVAEACGLSHKTIGKLRVTVTTSDAGRRIGRDGRRRPTDPQALRRRVADALATFPNASSREIATRTGASQGTVRDVRTHLLNGQPTDMADKARDIDASPLSPRHDKALMDTEDGEAFSSWWESHAVSDQDWARFVTSLPTGRAYEVADAAKRCSESWRRFAAALETQVADGRTAPSALTM